MTKREWIKTKKTQTFTGTFDETGCLQITDIAPHSPAHDLGLTVGDYIAEVDGDDAINIDLSEYILRDDNSIHYFFYSPANKTVLEVELDAIPLGALAEPSTKGIVKRCSEEGFYDWSALITLWKRQCWPELKEASESVYNHNPFARFIRLFKKRFDVSADELFLGAAFFELGKVEKAMKLINDFIQHDMNNHQLTMHAIAFYYQAKQAELNKNFSVYQTYLEQANVCSGGELDRINHEVSVLNQKEVHQRYRWENKKFPVLYNLKSLIADNSVSLATTLNTMKEGDLLPICMMPAYRGNGPYNEAMKCYRGIYKMLSHVIKPMHVLTDVVEKNPKNDWYYFNEEQALESELPLEILYDEDRAVADLFEADGTPNFYFINKGLKIVYEGCLSDSYYYWHALSKVDYAGV